MLRASMRSHWIRLLAPVALTLVACTPKIGSECLRSLDCSLQRERTCDLSYRVNEFGEVDPDGQGECIVDGCSATSCPSEAVCVNIFGTDFLTVPCDPDLEDRLPEGATSHPCCPGLSATCEDEGVRACVFAQAPTCCEEWTPACSVLVREAGCATCPNDDCLPREVCLSEGLCADANTGRTSCRKECNDDNDCRDGYICRQTGAGGIYPVLPTDTPDDELYPSICIPRGTGVN